MPAHRMPTVHAKLSCHGDRGTIEDAGSKNGTLVNGQPCTSRIELADGDVIETGHTFFVYGASVPASLGSEPATFAADTDGGLALTTFNPILARQYDMMARVSKSALSVVILGETGTGKEVVARALHRLSARKGAFVA